MKQFLIILSLSISLISCRRSENYSNSSANQLFRSKFNNTSWSNDSLGNGITFHEGKLFYGTDGTTGQSWFYTLGTYNNIDHDGCVYPTVINSIVSEDHDTFVCRQTTTSGAGNSCTGGTYIITFQVLNENTIQITMDEDGFIETDVMYKINNLPIQNAVDGTASGLLWN